MKDYHLAAIVVMMAPLFAALMALFLAKKH
jgi:hypothetical protein